MFCKNCGNKVDDGVKFCSKCGTPVGATEIPKNEEAVQMASSPIVSDKNAIIGKSYIFNNVKVSRSLLGFFFNGKVSFKFQDSMLFVTEETGTIADRTISLPYTDIKAYHFENKFHVSVIFLAVFCTLLGFFLMIFGDAWSIIVGLLFIVLGILASIRNALGSVFVVNTHSGKTFKIKLKRIKKEKLKEQNEFCNDLNLMIH